MDRNGQTKRLTIEVLTNHRELQIESNSVNASCIRFWEIRINGRPAFSGIVTFRTYDALIFVQHLVVLAQTDQEHEGGNVLETMNPLLPLRPLTADIE